LAATLTPSVSAAENPPSWKAAATAAILKRVSAGAGSATDVAAVKRNPELAKIAHDPSRTEVKVEEAVFDEDGSSVGGDGKPLTPERLAEIMPPADAALSVPDEVTVTPEETEVDGGASSSKVTPLAAAARVKGGKWKMTHVTHTHRSYLGSVIFKYHTYAEFNYGSGKVRAWGSRYDNFTNEQDIVDVDNRRLTDTKSRVPASSATSMMKRKVQLCVVKYGCYATLYPWAKTKVYGSGKTKIDGSGA